MAEDEPPLPVLERFRVVEGMHFGMCSICHDEIKVGQSVMLLPCSDGHQNYEHWGCIREWLHHSNECPRCRKKIHRPGYSAETYYTSREREALAIVQGRERMLARRPPRRGNRNFAIIPPLMPARTAEACRILEGRRRNESNPWEHYTIDEYEDDGEDHQETTEQDDEDDDEDHQETTEQKNVYKESTEHGNQRVLTATEQKSDYMGILLICLIYQLVEYLASITSC